MATAKIEIGEYIYVDSETRCGVKYRARVLKSNIIEVQYSGRRPARYTVDRMEPVAIWGIGSVLFDTAGNSEPY